VATAAVTVALATVLRPDPGLQVLTAGEEITFTLEATYSLPGLPQGMVFRGENDGYISFAQEGIRRFVLPSQPDGALQLELVVPDSGDLRGMAILKDTLFVAHNASVQRGDISQDTNAGDEGLLSPKGGSIIAFDILPNGQLQNRRTVVPDLPVANGWHSVNAVAAGPDGMLYVTIGGSRNSAAYADNPMLGTVLRFNPDGSGLEVVARGIRNIYDLTFDDQGRLFAADNDGPTDRGFKREEVLAIRKGDHYGYPVEGTSDIPHRVRTAPPLWVLSNTDSGSAGTEWAGEVGVADGLFIGGPHLKYLPILEDDRGYFVPASRDTEPGRILLDRQGFMTIVEAGPGRRLYVGVYGFTRTSDLYVLKFQ
ncbi:MAG TPA: PQQ-dependent sugar dehydrogenase, partial [Dehalococcoidia bacterium]|nr:PQQ-dependent sugar dehydrogenase [Dehalococcoidia bacterium]